MSAWSFFDIPISTPTLRMPGQNCLLLCCAECVPAGLTAHCPLPTPAFWNSPARAPTRGRASRCGERARYRPLWSPRSAAKSSRAALLLPRSARVKVTAQNAKTRRLTASAPPSGTRHSPRRRENGPCKKRQVLAIWIVFQLSPPKQSRRCLGETLPRGNAASGKRCRWETPHCRTSAGNRNSCFGKV